MEIVKGGFSLKLSKNRLRKHFLKRKHERNFLLNCKYWFKIKVNHKLCSELQENALSFNEDFSIIRAWKIIVGRATMLYYRYGGCDY